MHSDSDDRTQVVRVCLCVPIAFSSNHCAMSRTSVCLPIVTGIFLHNERLLVPVLVVFDGSKYNRDRPLSS